MRSSVTCSGSDSTEHRACALPPTTSSSSTPGLPSRPHWQGIRGQPVPPEAVRRFIRGVGASKANSTVDDGVLDAAIRDVLNERAQRRMAVLNPLKVTIENYPAGRIEEFGVPNQPASSRSVN